MKKIKKFLFAVALFSSSLAYAQIQNNGNTTYGGLLQDGFCGFPNGNTAQANQTACFAAPAVHNTGFGYNVLGPVGMTNSNLNCVDNTGVGYVALTNITVGNGGYNTGIGCQALTATPTGIGNTGVGSGAIEWLNNGIQNTAVGWDALQGPLGFGPYNYDSNTAIGAFAMFNNQTGNSNSAVGENALAGNIIGKGNCALGYDAGLNNTSNYNIAIGYEPLYAGTGAGTKNVAIGFLSMQNNNTGSNNVAIGSATLIANISGSQNVMVGGAAGATIASGYYNTGVGWQALDDVVISYG